MKKIGCFVILFGLSGCAHYADYQPKLASQPKDMARYEADRKFCLDDAMRRRNSADPLVNADAYKFPREMVDECMTSKGYNVVKIERHGIVNFN